MKTLGYKQIKGEHTSFIKHSSSRVIALYFYVDGIVISKYKYVLD